MAPDQRLLLQVFMSRDVAELRAIIEAKFTLLQAGKSTVISSSIDGASFQFNANGTLTPMDICMLAQQALNYKLAGLPGPVRRTQAFFI